jgi:hypothetical protein
LNSTIVPSHCDLDQGVSRQVEQIAQLALRVGGARFGAFRIHSLIPCLQERSDKLLVGCLQLRALAGAQPHLRKDHILLQPRQFGATLTSGFVKVCNVLGDIGHRLRAGHRGRRVGHGMNPSMEGVAGKQQSRGSKFKRDCAAKWLPYSMRIR